MANEIDIILDKLELLIHNESFIELESDTLEIKSVPASRADWTSIHESVNAFLNTRGGILLLGIKEIGQASNRKYSFTGYKAEAENKVRELSRVFKDSSGGTLDLSESFPPPTIRKFMDGNIALVYVDELSLEKKYCFLDSVAYRRVMTGDVKLRQNEIDLHEELKREAYLARELEIIPNTTLENFDIDKINDYIQSINRSGRIETIKPDLESATPFLVRKSFYRDGNATLLGMLVCGLHPGDILNFRAQLHGYVDMPGTIALDKQDYTNNVLSLMDSGLSYLLRNIQMGISSSRGGSAIPQYPEPLLRETVNNALAHRDYTIDRQVIVAIKPGEYISISNPGSFRNELLVETKPPSVRTLRILPEAKPRNPKLADVLRHYSKYEGRSIGMATLVNLCLQNEIDLPYYRLYREEVRLFICSGTLIDEQMELLFKSFEGYLSEKLDGREPTLPQKLVLAYLIKSEIANLSDRHTILLTPDNNHHEEISSLEQAGLIERHPDSPQFSPIFVASRTLMQRTHYVELQEIFGESFQSLNQISKDCLNVIYRYQRFSKSKGINAKQIGRTLWANKEGRNNDIRGFDNFTRTVRNIVKNLKNSGFVIQQPGLVGYLLNENFLESRLI